MHSVGEPRGLLLAAAIEATEAAALSEQGIEVRSFERLPSLSELAGAGLELRKAHPRARLLVSGPVKLVRQFERGYPALIDVPLTDTRPETVLAALS